MESTTTIPRHLGFIVDGNRRWATQHSLPEYDGHLAGYNALREVIEGAFELGVEFVSVYTFSTENWKRDKSEVNNIMKLATKAVTSDLKRFIDKGIRVRYVGRREGISAKLLEGVNKAEEATRSLKGGTVLVCFNYGGQQEIADAARQCVIDGLDPEDVTPEAIAARLYVPDVPPVDMIVRTSGEHRLSNFMLWRAAYSELYFMQKYWPDMTKDDVADIIKEYNRRQRRFGA
ncbi:MAG TPA: polyprenyl diphosphate synthase [Bacillota bacterium]|nr:polyprenyl diphosphate synthase [Bacillota bacterium]